MSGNSIGKLFTVTTFGESHGEAYGCIVDGCPPGLPLSIQDIQAELDKRKPGTNAYTSQRRENDKVQILSGLFEGKTTGTPIGLLILNEDVRSRDYEQLKNVYRPGHADFTYHQKYGHYDYRGGGRASARETVMRVAAGAIAKKFLATAYNIQIRGYLAAIGNIEMEEIQFDVIETNPFFCPDKNKISSIENLITQLRKEGNSIGAKIALEVFNVPIGLGEPIFDRLDAQIAHAMMSIPAVKAIEIGDGFRVVSQKGTEHRDEISSKGFTSNHSGGILGGISTGQIIRVNLALKPTSSIYSTAKTITHENQETEIKITGRHDPCVGLRAVPIAEAMMAITLMDHVLRDRAQNLNRERMDFIGN